MATYPYSFAEAKYSLEREATELSPLQVTRSTYGDRSPVTEILSIPTESGSLCWFDKHPKRHLRLLHYHAEEDGSIIHVYGPKVDSIRRSGRTSRRTRASQLPHQTSAQGRYSAYYSTDVLVLDNSIALGQDERSLPSYEKLHFGDEFLHSSLGGKITAIGFDWYKYKRIEESNGYSMTKTLLMLPRLREVYFIGSMFETVPQVTEVRQTWRDNVVKAAAELNIDLSEHQPLDFRWLPVTREEGGSLSFEDEAYYRIKPWYTIVDYWLALPDIQEDDGSPGQEGSREESLSEAASSARSEIYDMSGSSRSPRLESEAGFNGLESPQLGSEDRSDVYRSPQPQSEDRSSVSRSSQQYVGDRSDALRSPRVKVEDDFDEAPTNRQEVLSMSTRFRPDLEYQLDQHRIGRKRKRQDSDEGDRDGKRRCLEETMTRRRITAHESSANIISEPSSPEIDDMETESDTELDMDLDETPPLGVVSTIPVNAPLSFVYDHSPLSELSASHNEASSRRERASVSSIGTTTSPIVPPALPHPHTTLPASVDPPPAMQFNHYHGRIHQLLSPEVVAANYTPLPQVVDAVNIRPAQSRRRQQALAQLASRNLQWQVGVSANDITGEISTASISADSTQTSGFVREDKSVQQQGNSQMEESSQRNTRRRTRKRHLEKH